MKVDSATVAAGIAEAERIIEDVADELGIGSSTLRIVVDCVAGAIKAEHPRFHTGHFSVQALPEYNERLKQTILAAYGRERTA